jgi:NAD+ kinase
MASRLSFIAADTSEARVARDRLAARYGDSPPASADTLVVLGGDGAMLETLHRYMEQPRPIFGMNCGTVGFLMNRYDDDDLPGRIERARKTVVHPLRMTTIDSNGAQHTALAINEVSLLRQRAQAAKIGVFIDDVERLSELVCDGVLIATPAGSTAYNLSAHGPILPIGSGVLALTPISAFRPRRWRGAVLPREARVRFVIHEPDKRPVSATADFTEIRDVREVMVNEERSRRLTLLFDPGHHLEERILQEQFVG